VIVTGQLVIVKIGTFQTKQWTVCGYRMGNSRYEYRIFLEKHSFKCKRLCSCGTDCDVYCLM